jgi:hypothetical protein
MRLAITVLALALAWGTRPAGAQPVRLSDNLVQRMVEALASDDVAGRDNDTPGSSRAQEILLRRLRKAGRGLNPAGLKAEAYKQHFTFNGHVGTNLFAVIRGRELPDEYVMLGAHYDHLDTRSNAAGSCSSTRVPGGRICHGATDNASGAATVLAVGRALKKVRPRRSVILALWDAEEDGLAGSLYYVNNPLVPLVRTKAYVNLDILGSDLLPTLATTSFAVGPETGSTLAQTTLDAIAAESFGTLPISYIFGQLRSDYASFVAKQVPTVFFSDSTNGCYHTVFDDLTVVDWAKLAKQGRIAYRVVVELANAATTPAFVPPNPNLAAYKDALTLQRVFTLATPDLPLFSPADQVVITGVRDTIDQIVADGPGAFDNADVGVLLQAAIVGIAAIQRLGCRPL